MRIMEYWDKAAEDYQRVFALGLNEYSTGLLRFWHEEGMLRPGMRVIDIGCGVGKYGTYLAELGYDVTLTDISAEMLRHASENMAKYKTPWAVYRCDFNEVTGEEPVFADGFDLAISTMSPAVHDVQTVQKMSGMTRGWCFLARFQEWEQPLRDAIMRKMGMEPRRAFDNLQDDVASMTKAVSTAGFDPMVKLVPYHWSDRRSPGEMADYLCRTYFADDPDLKRLHDEALRIAESMCNEDGCVTDTVNTEVAWIYWKT